MKELNNTLEEENRALRESKEQLAVEVAEDKLLQQRLTQTINQHEASLLRHQNDQTTLTT